STRSRCRHRRQRLPVQRNGNWIYDLPDAGIRELESVQPERIVGTKARAEDRNRFGLESGACGVYGIAVLMEGEHRRRSAVRMDFEDAWGVAFHCERSVDIFLTDLMNT